MFAVCGYCPAYNAPKCFNGLCWAAGLEVLLDGSARSVAAYLMLLAWTAVLVVDMVWQQVKVDATLGHLIMGERPCNLCSGVCMYVQLQK